MTEEARLQEAVARAPGSAGAHRALGEYYLRAGQPFEALWELEQTRAMGGLSAISRQPSAISEKAVSHQPSAISENYPAVTDGRRLTADGLNLEIATALAMANLYPQAEAELKAMIAGQPAGREGRQPLAALLLATGRPEEAVAVLKGAPDLGEWREGQLLLGRAEEGMGQTAAARRAYERCIQLGAGASEGSYRLAHLLLTSGDPRGARQILEAALQNGTREARFLQLLAITYSARWGDPEQKDREGELLSQAIQAGGMVPGRLAMGELYLRHHRFQEGGTQLLPLADQQNLAAAHRGVAISLAGLGQPVDAWYHEGLADVMDGQADRALLEFNRMAARAPQDPRAPQLISQTDVQLDRQDEALKAVLRPYQSGVHTPEVYERLVGLYVLTHDRRAARRLCEEWERAQPNSGKPLADLGRVALGDLHLSEAVSDYEEALKREPKNPQFMAGLADALSRQPSPENMRRQIDLLQQAAELAPSDAGIRYQLGVSLQQQGRWEEARRWLLRVLDGDPHMAAAYNNLLQIAAALRQPALSRRFAALLAAVQARKHAEDAAWKQRWARPSDPAVYLALARLQLQDGELAHAEPQLERAVQLRPDWPDAAELQKRVSRLLDGIDSDGRRLVRFSGLDVTTETQRTRRGT